MSYSAIVNIIFDILFGLLGVFTVHFVIFAVIGLFKKRTFPETASKLKYGMIIPARNEESVVGNLVESIRRCKYPQENVTVFVIAHNCTDRTAEVARKAGAVVYEYNNPEECTMGYAFRHLFSRIEEDYGTASFDGFFLFNADNLVDPMYLSRMNDAFIACNRDAVITSFRNSKNFGANVMSCMYGLYFAYGSRMEARGRTYTGCSTRVQGTGYLVSSDIVKDGWKYVTLTEDWEFTADQLLQGKEILFCDDAVFYDEQPTTVRVMVRQRLRWSRGHFLVFLQRFRDLLGGLFRDRKFHKVQRLSLYDFTVYIMPVLFIGIGIDVLKCVLLLLSPLFGESLGAVMYGWAIGNLYSLIISYVTLALTGTVLYIAERGRIPVIRKSVLIPAILLFPLFMFEAIPSEIAAVFQPNLDWKPIPHTDTTCSEGIRMSLEKKKKNTTQAK